MALVEASAVVGDCDNSQPHVHPRLRLRHLRTWEKDLDPLAIPHACGLNLNPMPFSRLSCVAFPAAVAFFPDVCPSSPAR